MFSYTLVNIIGSYFLGSVYIVVVFGRDRTDRPKIEFGRRWCDALHLHVGGATAVDSGGEPVGYLNSILSFHSATTLILAFGSSKLCARSAHVPECVCIYSRSSDYYILLYIIYTK
jgi:hypothetical protein